MLTADQVDFQILGEDAGYLAVDKPAGLLVHPTRPGGPPTLWDGLCGLLGYELATGGQVSIINRLDRETSGVVVVAKTREAARAAGLDMEARRVVKKYEALVFGWPDWEELVVEAPIIRRGEIGDTAVHLERCVHPKGAYAQTSFRVLKRGEGHRGRWTRILAKPLTGRTHQIRVHLAHCGFPVIGDKIYAKGSSFYLEFIREGWTGGSDAALWLPRHALHCSEMKLLGRTWSAPLARDLKDFEDSLA
ncbi:MAG: RluA family pseudouridine synthase [Terrimicrobiaceae bacterium]